MKPEGIYSNGDLWFGGEQDEEGYWPANIQGNNDPYATDYGTLEMPERFPLFAMVIFPDGTPESEAQEYFLAKKIGDARFGSACQHARAKRGYCPDCLRKVL